MMIQISPHPDCITPTDALLATMSALYAAIAWPARWVRNAVSRAVRGRTEPGAARGRGAGLAALACTVLMIVAGAAHADTAFFRIGTGGAGATYFPIGTLIAAAVSEELTDTACGSACAGPDVLVVAQLSNGSVANVEGLQAGLIEGALAQANVVSWAYTGSGGFAGRPPITQLRAIASLYSETLHLVAHRAAGIQSVADLRGRRVSLDEPGSGTLIDVRAVLNAFALTEADLQAEYVKPDLAVERLAAGRLDAFFIVAGAPLRVISTIAQTGTITLVPIEGPELRHVVAANPFYLPIHLPAGTYPGIGETPTLAVRAQLITTAPVEAEFIYALTKALWSDRTRRVLDLGHPRGQEIQLTHALNGLTIPLHPGAERYYRERGMLP